MKAENEKETGEGAIYKCLYLMLPSDVEKPGNEYPKVHD